MNKFFGIAVVVFNVAVATWPAAAAPPADATWVLLGLDINMGAVTMRDTARDADTVSVYGEGLPVYQTAAACNVALRHAIQKYAGRSHAEGNFGRFLCVDWRTWATLNR
jgi:hypothetical protein